MTVQSGAKNRIDGKLFFEKNSKWLLIIAGVIAGIMLLLYGGGRLGGESSAERMNTSEHSDLAEYTERLEESIRRLCSNVPGVSDVTVAVTLGSGFEYVYAVDIKSKTDGAVERKYITVGSGSGQTPVYITEKLPSVAGIGIVCRGGSNPVIQQKLIALIIAAYNIGSNKIYITGS